VRALLDTHVLIWWARDEKLTTAARAAIQDGDTEVLVSAASIWEAEIKAASGKLELSPDLLGDVRGHGFRELSIDVDHAIEAARLPMHHPDPFDRMLIAQARLEGLVLLTRDPAFRAYDVQLLDA
jgi:PIN domain nuclease of toxin-antitoxin system